MKRILIVASLSVLIFLIGFISLVNIERNKADDILKSKHSFVMVTHSCSGDSCHAYRLDGTLRCDACCQTGTAKCSFAGCGCEEEEDPEA